MAVIFNWKIERGSADWIHLAQVNNHCRPLVNNVMNFWVVKKAENFLITRIINSFSWS
jgi:hypothetical protein